MKQKAAFRVVIGLIFLAGAASAAEGSTVQAFYEPESTILIGTLTRETFAGRPNYEDVKTGDEPETYWILNLSQPLDVRLKAGVKDELNEPEKGVRRLQMIVDYEKIVPKKIGFGPGKRIRVAGTLSHAITGHHHTDVLIDVQDAKLIE